MLSSMDSIINTDQKGFMKGRKISSNIRKIFDLIHHTDDKKIEAFILSLDFKSCFDLINFDSIIKALEFFNFSDWVIKWTKLLYTNYSVKIQNNGHFSEKIKIERSVHQGGVNSVNLFLCVAEVLAILIRNNKKIKGIPVKEIINLINQYADDMDIASLYDQTSLDEICNELEFFHEQTGFTVNYDKTKLYRIGLLKNSSAKLVTQKEIAWTNEPINILGIWVSHNPDQVLKINYLPLIQKAKEILESWTHRNLSLFGKINVINTLVGSTFVYRLTVLENMPQDMLKQLENMIVKFLWDGKKAKIPIEILQRNKFMAGQRLVDLAAREKSLKATWIQTISDDSSIANIAFNTINWKLKEWVFDCNLAPTDVKYMEIRNRFWSDMLKAWCEYNYENENTYDTDQPIWYNSNIRINNRPVFWEKCFRKGLWKISQLYEDGQPISFNKAYELYELTFMDLHSIVEAIPKIIKQKIKK